MTDNFLQDARANWRNVDADVAGLARRLRRRRRQSRISAAAALASASAAFAAGVWMLVSDLGGEYELLWRMAGVTLSLAVPVLTMWSWSVKRHSPRWEVETPEGVLRDTLQHLDVRARLLNVTRWHGYALAAFAVSVWVAGAIGRTPIDHVFFAFSLVYPLTAAGTWLWVRFHRAAIASERQRCEALLDEYQ
jgi:hypothetical protein